MRSAPTLSAISSYLCELSFRCRCNPCADAQVRLAVENSSEMLMHAGLHLPPSTYSQERELFVQSATPRVKLPATLYTAVFLCWPLLASREELKEHRIFTSCLVIVACGAAGNASNASMQFL